MEVGKTLLKREWVVIRTINGHLDIIPIREGQNMMDKPETFEEALAAVNDECDAILVKKRQDYGKDNIKLWGLLGVAVRMTDKVMRLRELLQSGKKPNYESIRDTLVDIRNYSTIGLVLDKNWWDLPLESERKEAES